MFNNSEQLSAFYLNWRTSNDRPQLLSLAYPDFGAVSRIESITVVRYRLLRLNSTERSRALRAARSSYIT